MITQNRLKELFNYSDGKLIRKITTGKKTKIGQIVGTHHGNGYIKTGIDGVRMYNHRMIFLYHYGYMPNEIDHINNNTSDNRIENLRECSRGQNACNKGLTKRNLTGIKGVHFDKARNKYVGCVSYNGIIFRKRFKTIEDAEMFVITKREELHGEFACHGGVSSL